MVGLENVQLDEDKLEQCIFAIGYSFSECLKNHVNPFDFANVIGDTHLNETALSILGQTYDQIVRILFKGDMKMHTPSKKTKCSIPSSCFCVFGNSKFYFIEFGLAIRSWD